MKGVGRHAGLALLAIGVTLAPVAGAAAQSVRITGTTTVRYISFRPLEEDSVGVDGVLGDGLIRTDSLGRRVRCLTDAPYCRFFRSGEPESTIPVVQDLAATVWGLGRGVRLFARVRARATASEGAAAWPRSDDPFDALEAYGELDRERYRVRAGRQWQVSGLGYYNFDGASLALRPTETLQINGFAGWSLARGLNESRASGALGAVEVFVPDRRGVLLGTSATIRPFQGAALTAVYQREVRGDRADFESERAAADAVVRIGAASLEGAVEIDLREGVANEARLDWTWRPGVVGWSAFARLYRPYFEQWTIWGAFEPVGFQEGGAGVSLSRADGRARGELRGAWRRYPETGAATALVPMRSDGWRVTAAGVATPVAGWSMDGHAGIELGFGAARAETSLRVQHEISDRLFAAVSGLAFQRVYEFRVDEGLVLGAGLDMGLRLDERRRLTGSFAAYSHERPAGATGLDWSQLRGSVRLDWTIGAEPAGGRIGR